MNVVKPLFSSSFSSINAGTAPLACLANSRSVVRLAGNTIIDFLQGLVTNDVSSLETLKTRTQPVYACILNAQGRYLHDLFLHRTEDDNGIMTVLADVDRAGASDLIKLLRRYRLRQKLQIDDVSDAYTVWVRFDTNNSLVSSDWPLDPRLPLLGHRNIVPVDAPVSSEMIDAATGYKTMRYDLGVAEGDEEMPSGDAIPLEFNIDGLNGISFTKGCYVGQELMARTHFQGVVRKRILPFRVKQGQGVHVGEKIDGIGKVYAYTDSCGLAMIRLNKIQPGGLPSSGKSVRITCDESTAVDIWKPDWWPRDWIVK